MCYTGRCHWWGTFAAWRWGFRCDGFCQHPGDFHTCSGAGRKNKFSWQLRMLLSFPSSASWGMGSIPPTPAGCWVGKGDFESPQILVQGQNPAQTSPHWCCVPSEQQGREKPSGHSDTPSLPCCCQSGMNCFLPAVTFGPWQ